MGWGNTMKKTIVLGAAFTLLAFQNCAKTNFSGTIADDPQAGLGIDFPTPEIPDGPVICDPLGGGTSVSDKNGLVGDLYYVPVADQSSNLKTLADVVAKAKKVDGTIFMSQVNVPTRRFEDGFAAAGQEPLKDDTGNKLIEYFGLRMKTELALTDDDAEGTYQLATISDDGLVVSSGSAMLAGTYDQIHSTRSDCGTITFTLKKGERLPLEVVYYQGPRNKIAAVMAWRKVADPASLDPKGCGLTDDNGFFAPKADGSGPWDQMSSVGWKVVPSANLFLPKLAGPNPCAM